MIKVNILWKFNAVGGGGNQFLRALRRYLISQGFYVEDPYKADVVLVNSKDCLVEASMVKGIAKNKIVHRIDGIFSLYRGKHERYNDNNVYDFAREYADGVIFQSNWSKIESEKNGMSVHPNNAIIYNCADNRYFVRKDKNRSGKIKLVTSSWSNNIKKGFEVYEYLDNNLDFDKYEYSFAGRSPILFKNIKLVGVLNSEELAVVLNSSDIFVTATEDDACSNSLIEGLACGCPAVVLDSGGCPEIIMNSGNSGEIFKGKEDVIEKINKVSDNLDIYSENINVSCLEDIGQQYYDFMMSV